VTGSPPSRSLSRLRDAAGRSYPLRKAATQIGRLPDNDVVLDDATVSRYHAMIVDTGNSFVITDLRSANGVYLADNRIRGSATLTHGDRIRVSDHEFTFEIGADS
jgi:SARP family transcriptional regulator, regulator of embCAB operon